MFTYRTRYHCHRYQLTDNCDVAWVERVAAAVAVALPLLRREGEAYTSHYQPGQLTAYLLSVNSGGVVYDDNNNTDTHASSSSFTNDERARAPVTLPGLCRSVTPSMIPLPRSTSSVVGPFSPLHHRAKHIQQAIFIRHSHAHSYSFVGI